jgi:hypothetical protein
LSNQLTDEQPERVLPKIADKVPMATRTEHGHCHLVVLLHQYEAVSACGAGDTIARAG